MSKKHVNRVIEGDAVEAIRAAILSPLPWYVPGPEAERGPYAAMRYLVPMLTEAEQARLVDLALWAGNHDALSCLAHCGCCCAEHTFESCPARVWYGCRGQYTMTRRDIEAWAQHYGMSVWQFLNPGEEA